MKKKPSPNPDPKPKVRTITLADLDVLPPPKRLTKAAPATLDVIEEQIKDFLQADFSREQAWQREAVYDRVAIGLCLLKGRELHLNISGRPVKCGNVSTLSKKEEKALVKAEEKADRGFIAWIEEKFPSFSTRTARNYMNGARNAGLTSDHSLEDVDALKASQALHDKTAKQLYQLKDALTNTKPSGELPPVNLVAETFAASRHSLGELRAVKDQMGPEEYELAWQMLKEELEAFTGAAWEMTDRKPTIDATEHGEMIESQHPRKGKMTGEVRAQIAAAMRERWSKKQAAKGKGARK